MSNPTFELSCDFVGDNYRLISNVKFVKEQITKGEDLICQNGTAF